MPTGDFPIWVTHVLVPKEMLGGKFLTEQDMKYIQLQQGHASFHPNHEERIKRLEEEIEKLKKKK